MDDGDEETMTIYMYVMIEGDASERSDVCGCERRGGNARCIR